MADLDLKSALEMFKSGMQDLSFSRALTDANEQVQQIKQSEQSDEKQRMALQDVGNALAQHMAAAGVPATTMTQVTPTVAPPKFEDADHMYMQGLLTGNNNLMALAKKQDDFESPPETGTEKSAALQSLDERKTEFNERQLAAFSNSINEAKASSRSKFGQWAQVEQRGERLEALMGNPTSWTNMNARQLALVQEGVGQMVKGGVPTKEEMEAQKVLNAATVSASLKEKATGNPASVDMSGYMNIYANLLQREKDTAKLNMLDTVTKTSEGYTSLLNRGPEASQRFKISLAKELNGLGMAISPSDIEYDKGKGIRIKQIDDADQEANKAKGYVQRAMADWNSKTTSTAVKEEARAVLKKYDVKGTVNPRAAGEWTRTRERTKRLFGD